MDLVCVTRLHQIPRAQAQVQELISLHGIYVMWGQHRVAAAQMFASLYSSNFDGMLTTRVIVDPSLSMADVRFLTRNHNRLLSEGTNETAEDKCYEVRYTADAHEIRKLPLGQRKKALRAALQLGE